MDHCYGMSADSLCADDLFKPDLPNILDCNLVISVLQSLINQEVAFLDGELSSVIYLIYLHILLI